MFRLETDEYTSQDDLPPEILRRLQVEQLWARRKVLAELMNAERFRIFAQRRADLAAGYAPGDVASRDRLTSRPATVVAMKSRKFLALSA